MLLSFAFSEFSDPSMGLILTYLKREQLAISCRYTIFKTHFLYSNPVACVNPKIHLEINSIAQKP